MSMVCRTDDEFLLSPLQQRVLAILQGRALHTDDLVREVGNAQAFFSGQGGFWELRHLGLVDHDAVVGNYRPDAPPPGVVAATVVGSPRIRATELLERYRQPSQRPRRGLRCDAAHAPNWARRPHAGSPSRNPGD